jgi:hypothetical protein
MTTEELARLAGPGQLFGVDGSNAGKVVIFGGGVPVSIGGVIVGGVGTSAGTVEQDIAVAKAAIAGLPLADSPVRSPPAPESSPDAELALAVQLENFVEFTK